MEELLAEIEESCARGNFYIALFCSLALPDMCAAISSSDGKATGEKYKGWFDKYVASKYAGNFSGKNCYAFRCGALHQGRAEHKDLGYEKVIFLAPNRANSTLLHNNIVNGALNLDLVEFCKDVVSAVRKWSVDEANNPGFLKNMEHVLRRHRGGIRPYIVGADVYC